MASEILEGRSGILIGESIRGSWGFLAGGVADKAKDMFKRSTRHAKNCSIIPSSPGTTSDGIWESVTKVPRNTKSEAKIVEMLLVHSGYCVGCFQPVFAYIPLQPRTEDFRRRWTTWERQSHRGTGVFINWLFERSERSCLYAGQDLGTRYQSSRTVELAEP